MGEQLSAVTGPGVLWRLRHRNERRLLCQGFELNGKLYLVLRDLDTGKVHVAESCPDVASLVDRAKSVRVTYMDCGWRVCTVRTAQC